MELFLCKVSDYRGWAHVLPLLHFITYSAISPVRKPEMTDWFVSRRMKQPHKHMSHHIYIYCILVRCARFAYVQFYKTTPLRTQTGPSHIMCISFSTCSDLSRRWPCPQQFCSFITCALQPLDRKSTKEPSWIIITKKWDITFEGSAVTGEGDSR